MGHEPAAITLELASLRSLGRWAADCAERALPIYEMHTHSDVRPRAAIEGIRAFADGERRTARLRSLAWAAQAAARDAGEPAASAAARAASLAAAIAYTHPLATVHQTKHILGPAAYAALALALGHADDPGIADREIRWAIAHASPEVCTILQQMPARQAGNGRLDTILYQLDAGIRRRALPPEI